MDSKEQLLPSSEPQTTPQRPNPKRSLRIHAAVLLLVSCFLWWGMSWQCPMHDDERQTSKKVPLEVHIMSKCPDTRDCLQKLVLPTMANVSDKVDFRMSYIGRNTDNDDGVSCPHGQTECLGDILELCAASEYPDPKLYLGFTMCLSLDYHNIPKRDLAENCAMEHGIDFDRLNDCMSKDDGAYGMDMLRDSVQRSTDLNISTSCTVRLNGKERCVHDGGEFKNCEGGSKPEDLIRDINHIYEKSRNRME